MKVNQFDPEERRKFAAGLAALREARGVSKLQLAKKAGISRRYLIWLEQGQYLPSADMVMKLAEALGMTEDLE